MGNKECQVNKLQLDQSQWIHTTFKDYYQNQLTHQICSAYKLQQISKLQYQTYSLRNAHPSFLPHLRGIIIQPNKQILPTCSSHHTYTALFQPILFRLPDLGALSFPQTLYILSQTLSAAQIIFAHFGPFHIYEDMIGFNQSGQCKIWYNSNFLSCEVEHAEPLQIKQDKNAVIIRKVQELEENLIEQMCEVIEGRTQESREFNMYLESKNEYLKQIKLNQQGKCWIRLTDFENFLKLQLESVKLQNLADYKIDVPIHEDIQEINRLSQTKKQNKNTESVNRMAPKMSLKPYNSIYQFNQTKVSSRKLSNFNNPQEKHARKLSYELSNNEQFKKRRSFDSRNFIQKQLLPSPKISPSKYHPKQQKYHLGQQDDHNLIRYVCNNGKMRVKFNYKQPQ